MDRTGRHARRWYWSLIVISVLAMSVLGAALGAEPGPGTGWPVLGSLLFLGAATQATRIQLALERTRRNARAGTGAQQEVRGTEGRPESRSRRGVGSARDPPMSSGAPSHRRVRQRPAGE